MSFVERRGYERIEYPPGNRPVLITDASELEVVDCSERGLRYQPAGAPPEIGSELLGRVRFPTGTEVRIQGAVLRVQDDSTVAVLFTDQWIPRDVIIAERWRVQRFAKQPTPETSDDSLGS